MKVLGIAGHSGMGKTTLLARLVARLVAQGLRVSMVKHSHKDIEVDRPGKDSFRLREAGCQEVLLLGTTRWALMHELRGAAEPALDTLVSRIADCDLLLVEGFKSGDFPKLEVWRAEVGKPPLAPHWPGIHAIATDGGASPVPGVPALALDDLDAIVAFVEAHAAPVEPVAARDDIDPRALLRAMFDAAIASAQPAVCVPPHLPSPADIPPGGRLVVIGAGKASAAMARAVEDHWPGPLTGLVVTRYGYGVACDRIEIVEAAHPVPDAAGEAAARRLLDLVTGLTEDDVVLALVSGGGSALLPLPVDGVSLADVQALARALLASGAPIGEMNTVRRHLSAIQGGRLAAAAHPARVITLAMSDVPGDSPVDIASGPTVADPSTCDDALAILKRHGIDAPPSIVDALSTGRGESVKPGDPRVARAECVLVATPQAALEAAARVARGAGLAVHLLGDAIEGEAREVGRVMAGLARQVAQRSQPFAPPCVLLSGGETTVTVKGQGRGGRNVEFLLSLAIALDGQPGVHALAGDTDGVDGLEEIAGAIASPDTLARARALGLRPRDALDDNDGHGFFGRLGDSVVTGPTLTNVNDFRAILVVP